MGIVVAVLPVVSACGGGTGQSGPSGPLRVVATIYPLQFFADRVAGDRAEVVMLVTAGVEAHSFEPTAGDLQTIAGADLMVINGLALEPWVGRAFEALGSSRPSVVVEATDPQQVVPAADHGLDDGLLDPHLWLDPLLAIGQVERVRDALLQVDPAGSDAYASNANALLDELRGLDAAYRARLASCRFDRFVTTHAAYGYLAARYGLVQLSIAGVSPEAEPTVREMAELTDTIRAIGLRHLLAEPSLSARLAETVAAESGLEILPIHQLETATAEELAEHGDYLGLMHDNLASLAQAMECEG